MSDQPLHLFDLPIEVLSDILRPLLTTIHPDTPIPIISSAAYTSLACPSCILPILLTHPRLHSIAIPILYGPEHEFSLDLTGENHAPARRLFAAPVAQIQHTNTLLASRDALRRISRLSLHIDRLRGWMGEHVVPLLADMILKGQLTHLDVMLVTGGTQRLRYQAERLAPESPFAGIMGVLADPYLRSARMYVQRSHESGWCQFHKDGECNGQGSALVEVDWASIMREAGTEREQSSTTR